MITMHLGKDAARAISWKKEFPTEQGQKQGPEDEENEVTADLTSEQFMKILEEPDGKEKLLGIFQKLKSENVSLELERNSLLECEDAMFASHKSFSTYEEFQSDDEALTESDQEELLEPTLVPEHELPEVKRSQQKDSEAEKKVVFSETVTETNDWALEEQQFENGTTEMQCMIPSSLEDDKNMQLPKGPSKSILWRMKMEYANDESTANFAVVPWQANALNTL